MTQSCDGAQLGQALAVAGDEVVEDLAQAGGDRAQLRPLDAVGGSSTAASRSLTSWRAK